MSKALEYEKKTEELISPVINELGLNLYDVEYVKEAGQWYLRVYIDKEDGVTVNDCENVSRAFNPILDEKDFIDDAYIFEVSSPGLGRTLKKDKHFDYSMGEEVEIHTYKPINNSKQFIGFLTAYDKDTITITDEKDNKTVFKRSDVSLVRLTVNIKEDLKNE